MAEADLRHVSVVGFAGPEGRRRVRVSGGEEGVRPARAEVRTRGRLGPFKPRRAGARVNPAPAQSRLSGEWL